MRWDLYLYAIIVVALLGVAFWDRVLRDLFLDLGWISERREAEPPAASSNVSDLPAPPYVAPRLFGAAPSSLPSTTAQEGSEEGSREVTAEAREPAVFITEKALQGRLRDAYEQGAIHVYAALLHGGYLEEAVKARRLGALKQTIDKLAYQHSGLFGATAGNNLQRFNRLVDAVPVAPAPASPIMPAELKPLSENPRPAGVRYAGEQPADATPV